jgi:hypothetical protein
LGGDQRMMGVDGKFAVYPRALPPGSGRRSAVRAMETRYILLIRLESLLRVFWRIGV